MGSYKMCVSIASSGLGRSIGEKYVDEIHGVVKDAFFTGLVDEHNVESYPACQLSLVLVVTGGTEHVLREIASRSRHLALFYTSKYNSLPAVMEFLAYYRDQGREPLILEEYRGRGVIAGYIDMFARVMRAVDMLHGAGLGVIGGVSPWLIYSRIGEEALRSRINVEIINIGINELLKEFEEARVSEEEASRIISSAEEVAVEPREVYKAYRLYKALEALVRKYGLKGFTIKCFDIIPLLGTTACIALSLFNTSLTPASCEGDVPLLLSMALGEWVTMNPVFMANTVALSGNHVVFAHCTAPMIGGYKLLTHFETGLGVALRVNYKPGTPVTVYRIDNGFTRMRIGVGRIVEHEWSSEVCRTQVKVELRNPERLLMDSIGNHYAIVIGDHTRELELASKILGLRVEYV